MRLPTIDALISSAAATAARFPLVIAAALTAAGAGFTIIDSGGEHDSAERLLAAASLALPLLFALATVAERRVRGAGARTLLHAAGIAVIIGVWWSWPTWPIEKALRYAQLSAAFHLFVAFAPYTSRGEPVGFWQYNKALFLRFLTAALYSGVLYGGLAVAMLALNKLLGVPVRGENYGQLWVLIAFVFNTWFFLGGVPRDFAELDARTDYPTGLRVFTQYILVPLVAVYVVILTLYLGKVVLTHKWPSGWIGYLVSCVAAIGILAWLLVHPLEERAEYAWVKAYTRGFYLSLMPAIVMLWLAIWQRLHQHGLTEKRYLLLVLSVWLAAVALYYTFTRSRSIKFIPATLCAVAVLTFVGPGNAYTIARANQFGRLNAALARNNLLRDGKLQRAATPVSRDDQQEISSALEYLIHEHGLETIRPMLSDSLHGALVKTHPGRGNWYAQSDAQAIMKSMNIDFLTNSGHAFGEYFGYYAQPMPHATRIRDFDLAVEINGWPMRDSVQITDSITMRLTADSTGISLTRLGAPMLTIPLSAAMDSVPAYQAKANTGGKPGPILVSAESGGVRGLLVITQIGGSRTTQGARVTTLMGQLFLRVR